MRKIASTYIFTKEKIFLKNSIIVLNDAGTIIKIVDTKGKLREEEGTEHYSGLLVPAVFQGVFNQIKEKQLDNPQLAFSELTDLQGFELGTNPGICLISGMNLINQKLLPSSTIKRLV